MHVDFYLAPPAPSPYRAPSTRRPSTGNNFIYTGDQFLFSGQAAAETRPYQPPREPDTSHGFWHWLGQLFN